MPGRYFRALGAAAPAAGVFRLMVEAWPMLVRFAFVVDPLDFRRAGIVAAPARAFFGGIVVLCGVR